MTLCLKHNLLSYKAIKNPETITVFGVLLFQTKKFFIILNLINKNTDL